VSFTCKAMIDARTIEVGGAHKRDVHAQVAVVRGAVEAEVDAERHRRPRRVLLAAVKAYLMAPRVSTSPKRDGRVPGLTLLAGLDLSFSKILCDCCLVARPLILGRRRWPCRVFGTR